MPGFDTGSVMYALNVDFTGNSLTSGTAQVTQNGQLLIGSSTAPNIRVGTLGSSDGSIVWAVGNGTITGQVAGGITSVKTINNLPPTNGNITIAGTTNEITVTNAGSTVTLSVPTTFTGPGYVASTTYVNAGTFLSMPVTSATQGYLQIGPAAVLQAYGSENIFVGTFSGNTSLTSTYSTGCGYGTLTSLTNGGGNTAVGGNSGNALTSGTGSTSVGYQSLLSASTTNNNTCIGYDSGLATIGSNNTSLGTQSLYGFGNSSGASNNNTCLGCYSGYRLYTGTDNCLVGYSTGPYISSGTFNTGIADSALANLTTGSYNTTLGYNSGSGYTSSESSNICIGANGTAAESNVLRIGTAGSGNGQVNACYIAGISGVTVTGTAVLCSASGQLGTISSSIRYKENIKPIENDVTVMNLQVKSFNYKSDENKERMYGLIAEEVHEAFPYLCHYNVKNEPESVNYHELCTFLLVEIQRLNERVKCLEK